MVKVTELSSGAELRQEDDEESWGPRWPVYKTKDPWRYMSTCVCVRLLRHRFSFVVPQHVMQGEKLQGKDRRMRRGCST